MKCNPLSIFMLKNKDFAILAGITVLSVIISLLCWSLEPTVSRDGILYLDLIQIWYKNGDFQDILDYWPQYWIPPLPLYLMPLLMHCGLSAESAGVGLNLVLGSLIPLIIYGIAIEVCNDRRIAFCAALLMALNPTRIELSIEPQRDMIYLFFCGLLIYFLLCGIRRQKWYFWCMAGLAFGMSFLTRYETLEFVPLFAVAFILMLWYDCKKWKKYLLELSCLLFSVIVALSLSIYIMGVQEHILKSYRKYLRGKWILFEKRVLQDRSRK